MKKIIGLLCLLSFTAFSMETKKVENLSNVKKVFIDGGNLNVKIKKASEEKIEIFGDVERIKDLKIEVIGDKLIIRDKDINTLFSVTSKKLVQINVNIKNLDEVDLDGSADLSISDFIGDILKYNVNGSGSVDIRGNNYKNYELILGGSGDIRLKANAEKVKLTIEGSGNFEGELTAESIETLIDGSGDVELKGIVKEFKGKIEGSGNIDAYELKSSKSSILIAGSGNAEVYVIDEFLGTIEGSGDIKYKGNPKSEKINNKGSGTIRKK